MGKSSGSTTSGSTEQRKKSKAKMYYQKQSRGNSRGGGGYRGRGGRGGSSGNRGRGPARFLIAGMKGFLCTTNFREKNAVKEAYNLLNEYCDERDEAPAEGSNAAAPPTGNAESFEPSVKGTESESTQPQVSSSSQQPQETPAPQKVSNDDDDDDDDFESAMKSEIRTLKSDEVRYKFQSVDTGVPNLVFISTTIADPVQLAHRILDDITSTKEQKSQALLRMIPIETTCRAEPTEIKKTCHILFPKYFKTGFNSFQIIYKCRYNNSMDRGEVIRVVAEAVMEINSFNTVNLNDPKFVVIVEIIKGLCCLSVVTDFNKFRKYNLIEVSGAGGDATKNSINKEEVTGDLETPIDATLIDATPAPALTSEIDSTPNSQSHAEEENINPDPILELERP